MASILAGPVVWGGVGWLLDRWLGTDPWLLSVGIMAGFASGLYIVWLRSTPHADRGSVTGDEDGNDREG